MPSGCPTYCVTLWVDFPASQERRQEEVIEGYPHIDDFFSPSQYRTQLFQIFMSLHANPGRQRGRGAIIFIILMQKSETQNSQGL